MRLAKAVALAGLALVVLGIIMALLPATQEVWEKESEILAEGKAKVYTWGEDYTVLLTYPLLMSPEDYRNLVVRGRVEEASGRPFDLIIEPYVRAENVSSYEFEFSPEPQEVREGLKMLIVNRAMERVTEDFLVETVTLYEWMKSHWWFVAPLPPLATEVLVYVSGTATESGGHAFNLYFLDKENFEKWKAGLPFDAYFKGTGSSSYTFSFTVPPEKSTKEVYYVVERVGEPKPGAPELRVFISSKKTYEKPVDIEVSYRVEMSWEERSYAPVLGGLVLGGGLLLLGIVLLIAAAILRFVFKR